MNSSNLSQGWYLLFSEGIFPYWDFYSFGEKIGFFFEMPFSLGSYDWLLTNLLMLSPAVVDCYLGGLSELYLASCFIFSSFIDARLGQKTCFGQQDISKHDASRGFISTCPLRLGCVLLECSFLEAHLRAI